MIADYAGRVGALLPEGKLYFYELLAHSLTIAIRGVCSEEDSSSEDKLEAIKSINEIMHRVTSRIWSLRLGSNEWTEADFQAMIESYIADNPRIAGEIDVAIQHSYTVVIG